VLECLIFAVRGKRPPRQPDADPDLQKTGTTEMSFFNREQCLQRLRAQIAAGKPIIGGGAGTGISAKCAEAAAST